MHIYMHIAQYCLTWAVLHIWTQNYPQNVGTCPGLPLQLLARNPFYPKWFGKIGPKIDQIWVWLSREHRWAPGVWNPLKSLFTGPSFAISKSSFTKNQGEPPPPLKWIQWIHFSCRLLDKCFQYIKMWTYVIYNFWTVFQQQKKQQKVCV